MDLEQDEREKDEFFDPIPSNEGDTSPKKSLAKRIGAVACALLLVLAAFLAGWFGRYYALDEEVRTYLWAKSVAERNYYHPLDEAELYEKLYDTLSLDPYSELFSPSEYESYMASGAGENVGVGISLSDEKTDGATLPRLFLVVENSPASLAGLRKGMYVFGCGASEDALTAGTSKEITEIAAAQKGNFILRCGYEADGSDARNYTLSRRRYQAAYVSYRDSETSFRFRGEGKELTLTETGEPLAGLDGKTAYLRLDEFSGNASAEFEACLGKMKERGRTDLILDLRTNGGGYLDILGDIASLLLRNADSRDPVVAAAVYRDGRRTEFRCGRNDFGTYFDATSRICVLADENTASASECLIGALIDYGTIGYSDLYLREDEAGVAKTYGKGIMQSHFENSNGAAMKLTVATVRWPVSDKCIHGVGVTKADGAKGIPAALIWGKSDPMLEAVLQEVCG